MYCKNRIGNRHVERGNYHISQTHDARIISPSDFAHNVRPGMALAMSIVFRRQAALQNVEKECPQCYLINPSATQSNGWIAWKVPSID